MKKQPKTIENPIESIESTTIDMETVPEVIESVPEIMESATEVIENKLDFIRKGFKTKKPHNYTTAIYIAQNHGNNVSDKKLIEVAKALNISPISLIKNYHLVVSINEIIAPMEKDVKKTGKLFKGQSKSSF